MANVKTPWILFESMVNEMNQNPTDECVEWPLTVNHSGYGMIGKKRVTHLILGDKPDGAEVVMHSCDNPPCINPNHLKWGTISENIKEMWDKGRGSDNAARRLTKTLFEEAVALYDSGTPFEDLVQKFPNSFTLKED